MQMSNAEISRILKLVFCLFLPDRAAPRSPGPQPARTGIFPPPGAACQFVEPKSFSRLSVPYPLFLARRTVLHLRVNGLKQTLRKAIDYMGSGLSKRRLHYQNGATLLASPRGRAVLDLQPGEWIEVRSEAEIQKTLDAQGKNQGLTFLPEMKRFCGKRLRVHKRLEKMFLEESKQVRKLKSTVLLDGSFCEGEGVGCDRSCFLYWREAWLRKIDPPESVSSASTQ